MFLCAFKRMDFLYGGEIRNLRVVPIFSRRLDITISGVGLTGPQGKFSKF